MPLILNIDTSTQLASIALAQDGKVLDTATNEDQRGHAAWIHNAIRTMAKKANIELKLLDAVALTSGPGSYTGLRVGMATAKGLCYALGKPIIAVNTLYAMAWSMREKETDFLCPMMDAGRMEVYTALYNRNMEEIMPPAPLILDEFSFSDLLLTNSVSFFGSGKNKFSGILNNEMAIFPDEVFQSANMCLLTHEKFLKSDFDSLAYLEPVYLKEEATLNNYKKS